jgi:DNA ligase-1
MLEATDQLIQTQQVARISRDLDSFNTLKSPRSSVLIILDKDNLSANNLGLAKAKKWMAKIFDVFEDEIDGLLAAHNDLGEAIYYLDPSAEKQRNFSVNYVLRILQMNCGKIESNEFSMIEETVLAMSANARRWFIRYMLRTPRNGMNIGTVTKIMAKYYKKKQADVKKHLNFNSIEVVCSHYEEGTNPPCNLTYGKFIKPMLAKEVPMNKWPTDFVVDYKYDGNRYQIHIDGDKTMIFNRKGKIVTQQFPDVVELVQEYDIKNAILDGEIYPILENGSPAPHKQMGTRVHSKNIQEAMERVKVEWVIFDCLMLNNETVMDLSYTDRLEKMENLPNQAHRITEGDIMAFYHEAINEGFEGIIVKDASQPYQSGKRSVFWAKYKPPQINLDVVVLSAKYGEGKRSSVFGTYELGVKAINGYHSVGWCGTGFSDSDLINLTNTLRRNVESFDNGRFFVSPVVILEVKADLVSRDEKGNLGLRFPRCVRIRDDKFVADINTLEDVESLE